MNSTVTHRHLVVFGRLLAILVAVVALVAAASLVTSWLAPIVAVPLLVASWVVGLGLVIFLPFALVVGVAWVSSR